MAFWYLEFILIRIKFLKSISWSYLTISYPLKTCAQSGISEILTSHLNVSRYEHPSAQAHYSMRWLDTILFIHLAQQSLESLLVSTTQLISVFSEGP